MAVGDPCDVCGQPIPQGSWGPTRRCSEPCRLEARRRAGRARYAADPKRFIGYVVKYHERHPERYRAQIAKRPIQSPATYRRWNLMKNYGLTIDQYDAMFEAQGGLCAICGRPEVRLNRGRVQMLCVDHDHETGRVRGLLCGRCNSILFFFEDGEFFAAATDYLRRHSLEQEVS